jgi:hypothetical protein
VSSPPTPAAAPQPPSGEPSRPARARPWSIVGAAALVGLEAVVLLSLGGYVVVEGIVGDPASWVYVVWIAGLAIGAGVALSGVARGLLAARRWSRSPAVLTQLLAIAVAYEPLRAVPAVRWAVLAVAGATLVLLFVRPSNQALHG